MNISRALFASLFLIGLPVYAPSAFADAFYCGTFTIREGMPIAEIQEKCGPADVTRTRQEPIYARLETGGTIQVGIATTEYRYYDRGPNQFVARIEVRDDVAKAIELLPIRDIDDLTDEL